MTKTIGLNPKVPIQAVTVIVTFLLGYFGIDLPAEVAASIATVLGFAAGVIAPPAPTLIVGTEDPGAPVE